MSDAAKSTTRLGARLGAELVLAFFLCSGSADAQSRDPVPPDRDAILRAAEVCSAELLHRVQDALSWSDEAGVFRFADGRLVLRSSSWGSGIDGSSETSFLELDPTGRAVTELDEALTNNLPFVADVATGAQRRPSLAALRRFEPRATAYVPGSAARGAHRLARDDVARRRLRRV